ncbi:MAG: energy transducer TonB, partial [Alphaproteobacteria bacterium]
MMKRLLIALPVAAAVVAALFWAMSEFVPVERPQAEYRVVVSKEAVSAELPEEESRPHIFDPPEPQPPPPPSPDTQPDPVDPQPMPREKFPPPEREKPENVIERQGVHSHCYRHRTGPLEFLDGAREGDRVMVEFTITSDGRVTDVRVIKSTNPAINDAVAAMVRRWRWKRPDFCGRQVHAKQKPRTLRTEIEFRKP